MDGECSSATVYDWRLYIWVYMFGLRAWFLVNCYTLKPCTDQFRATHDHAAACVNLCQLSPQAFWT